MILAVDLAARFSAGIVLDDDREVRLQFDSWRRDAFGTSEMVAELARVFDPDVIVIEDVPYGISQQFMIKPVLRHQGILIAALWRCGFAERTVFVAPATWQRAMGVFPPRKSTEKQKVALAAEAALGLGYTPPDLFETHAREIPAKGPERTKIRTLLHKATTDYVDAYLIARWADVMLAEGPLTDVQGVQPAIPEGFTWPRAT